MNGAAAKFNKCKGASKSCAKRKTYRQKEAANKEVILGKKRIGSCKATM